MGNGEAMSEVEYLIGRLESECCDLRCRDVPTCGDDFDIEWAVIEHHMDEPHERVIGVGRTPLLAMRNAFATAADEGGSPWGGSTRRSSSSRTACEL